MSDIKYCGGCRQELPTAAFHKSTTAQDGLQYRCKMCRKRYERMSNERRRAVRQRDRLQH